MFDACKPFSRLGEQIVHRPFVLFRENRRTQVRSRSEAACFLSTQPLGLGFGETLPLRQKKALLFFEARSQRFQRFFLRAQTFGRAFGSRPSGDPLRLETLKFRFGRRLLFSTAEITQFIERTELEYQRRKQLKKAIRNI